MQNLPFYLLELAVIAQPMGIQPGPWSHGLRASARLEGRDALAQWLWPGRFGKNWACVPFRVAECDPLTRLVKSPGAAQEFWGLKISFKMRP